MKRSEAREAAFLLLFADTFTGRSVYDDILSRAQDCWDMESDEYTKTLYNGVNDNLAVLDGIINKYSTKWQVNRLNRVMLVALRICIYEIETNGKADAAVYINEALELIKKYDMPDSVKYANGVLGSYVG